MKKLAVLLPIFLPLMALAQNQPDSVVTDTLDWHRYYPLEVGNVWEYQVSEGEPLLVHRIMGELITSEQHYYLMEVNSWEFIGGSSELGLFWQDTLFVRYADVGGIFKLSDLEADTLSSPQDMPLRDGSIGFYNLQSAFGDSVFYSTGPEDFYVISGGYEDSIQIGSITYVPPAVKRFSGGFFWECYAADIGLLYSRNLWGPNLTYAKVAGVEYGFSRVPTSVEDEQSLSNNFTIDALYPNPMLDKMIVSYRVRESETVTVGVFNILGQRVFWEEIPPMPIGLHSFEFETASWNILRAFYDR